MRIYCFPDDLFIWCVTFKLCIRFCLYSRLNLGMKCCLALFLLFYMIHDDCVIFHCIKNADSVLVQNIFLKMTIIKIQGKGASTWAVWIFLQLWHGLQFPKQTQAEDEFCLERCLVPTVPIAVSSCIGNARFPHAVALPEAVLLVQRAKK